MNDDSRRFSVIIPTLWIPSGFPDFLSTLLKNPSVGEVIVIDNNKSANPLLRDDKLITISPHSNIFVNPAWNLGVRHSRFNNLCIANDDIIFKPNTFDVILKLFESDIGNQVGVVGLDWNSAEEPLDITVVQSRPICFGCLMFMKSENYFPIPTSLKVWCGDDYIFLRNQLQGRKNYVLRGAGHSTVEMSASVSKTPNVILKRDMARYSWIRRLIKIRHQSVKSSIISIASGIQRIVRSSSV